MALLTFFTETIAVDPGSYALRIAAKDGLVFNERTQISIDQSANAVSGIGDSVSRTERDLLFEPVDFVIGDFNAFEMLLRGAIKKGLKQRSFLQRSLKIFFCIPSSATTVDMRAYRDSGEHAGAVEVYMMHQSCCAAIGLNILFEVRDFILIDFGGSKAEIAVFVESRPISVGVFKTGTKKIFHMVKSYLLRQHKINVSDQEVADIFETLGKDATHESIRVQHITLSPGEIHEVLRPYFTFVNDEIRETIERVTNQTEVGKALANGVYFTGGGSAIPYLRRQIELGGRIKTTVSSTPQLDCINGVAQVMADKEKFKSYLMT
ncbi:rod shape-determining protein [Chryseolinea soli]|uniref:Rod shape-determining protein n=1 Tax=Chryseolinea soli TaxID=2321403 RepID=A0A385SFV2_9BACT|nr:rod shape-determining protein [Chryseolinea soli]AYB29331.1 hypothetical protein D4L85_01470 [Chryseolinea soli]